jgi:hypothetical protein
VVAERIDDFAAHSCIITSLHAKAQHATKQAFPKRLERQMVRRVGLKAHVGDSGDLLVLLEVSREGERILGVAFHAKQERLEALHEERTKGLRQASRSRSVSTRSFRVNAQFPNVSVNLRPW